LGFLRAPGSKRKWALPSAPGIPLFGLTPTSSVTCDGRRDNRAPGGNCPVSSCELGILVASGRAVTLSSRVGRKLGDNRCYIGVHAQRITQWMHREKRPAHQCLPNHETSRGTYFLTFPLALGEVKAAGVPMSAPEHFGALDVPARCKPLPGGHVWAVCKICLARGPRPRPA
jgi:hypothetical protein